MDIKALHASGKSIKEIVRTTGIARNTVRCILRGEHKGSYHRPPKPDLILKEFEGYLRQEWPSKNAVVLCREIRAMGYTGSEVTVRRFRKKLKSEAGIAAKATLRFETPPGVQAQVDWGEVGRLTDETGRNRKLYVFVYVLGFSRQLYAEFTYSMRLPFLIGCHQHAFEAMEGWPEKILYDNMAQVRLPSGKLTPLFQDFASHHGFTVKTHKPYRPRTKGKVERMVHYIKDNFLPGKTFVDLADANGQLTHWLKTLANQRVHGTTGEVPAELFETREKATLTPLKSVPVYRLADSGSRKVSYESTVAWAGNHYSVPPEHISQVVDVESFEGVITIRSGNCVLAEHEPFDGSGKTRMLHEHQEALWKLTAKQTQAHPSSRGRDLTATTEVQQRDLAEYERVVSS